VLVSLRLTPSYSFYSLCDYSVAQVSGKSPSRSPAQSLGRYSENGWSRTHLHVLMSAFMKTAKLLSISVSHLRQSIPSLYFHLDFKLKLPDLLTFAYISSHLSFLSRHHRIGFLKFGRFAMLTVCTSCLNVQEHETLTTEYGRACVLFDSYDKQ
jgi:hypothetical protein